MAITWLADGSAEAVRDALRAVAPELAGCSLDVEPDDGGDSRWRSGTAIIGERFFAKFAWSRQAALRVAHEIAIVTTLAREPAVPFLPEVVAGSTDPVLLITRLVPGASLFDVADSIDRDRAAGQLARFLATLHHPDTRARAEAVVGPLTGTHLPPATTDVLRARIGPWIRPDQRRTVMDWFDWADAALASPGPTVLVHGDFHGDNQVWDAGELHVVVDFENAGAAEPEYDLRTFPGTGHAGVELLLATMGRYRRFTGRQLSAERVMAWHLRQDLYDVMWRSEAGLPMADGRTPPDWVENLSARFAALGINPDR